MRNPNTGMIIALAISPLLGGCQSIFGGGSQARFDAPKLKGDERLDFAAIQLEVGRAELNSGNYAQAATAFRAAAADPAHSADAYNGLAVVYARLGRTDLAERFFDQAITLAPTDERYKANLARLYRTSLVPVNSPVVESAMADAAGQAATLAASLQSDDGKSANKLTGAVSVASSPSRLIRVSANEVRIGSPDKSATEMPAAAKHAKVAVVVRKSTPKGDNYPIRVELPGQGSQKRGNYPIKVSLSPAQ